MAALISGPTTSDQVEKSFRVLLTERNDAREEFSFQHFPALIVKARENTPHCWAVSFDFETVLRAMQRASDRQRTLAAHNSLLSDSRLQSCVTDVSKIEQLEGRVWGHGKDEANGKAYMLLEGTDHNVHFIYITLPRSNVAVTRASFGRIPFSAWSGRRTGTSRFGILGTLDAYCATENIFAERLNC